ncbi:MAG: NTP transferase domain-containing protein [Ornithinimicrobium sp.]
MKAVDVVVLVGGRGTRLGGVDKATVVVDGQMLLSRLLASFEAEADDGAGARLGQVVVVGRAQVPPWVRSALEDPPGSGPVAAIAAGLATLSRGRSPSMWTLVLAVDQPGAPEAVPQLCSAVESEQSRDPGVRARALVPVDAEGRWQWLLAAYGTDALREAILGLDDLVGAPMHRVFTQLTVRVADVDHDLLGDIDTPADLKRWNGTLTAHNTVSHGRTLEGSPTTTASGRSRAAGTTRAGAAAPTRPSPPERQPDGQAG